jgi:penicillin-binding protein 1A
MSGNLIETIGDEKIKDNVSISDIPENLKNAYISIEDQRYYSHHGVDIKRTGAAILSYISHGGSSSFGGSTITQQLVKNLTGDSSSSVSRKIKEWIKAFELEIFCSKDEILESYFNIIYVGPNVYGVSARCSILF